MAGSSNIPDASARIEDYEYLYASNANVSNFVSVKLSSDRNYHLWKTQMLCLMKSHNMGGIVDAAFASPRASSTEIMDRYDSLLKGWIFGSVSENVLGAVADMASAKDVWDKLKSFYDATVSTPQEGEDMVSTKSEAEAETEVQETCPITEIGRTGEDTIAIEVIITDTVLTKPEPEGEDSKNETKDENKVENKKNLREATLKGDWPGAESILKKDKDLANDAISNDGSTLLHIAVGIGHKDFVNNLILYINEEQVLEKRISDGSTALHIAALVGNTYAADLLVEKNKELLRIEDHKGEEPLHKAYENMHLDTIGYLLKADDGKSVPRDDKIGVDLLVNAISAKQYNLASIENFRKFASKSDDVLMALAKTFPSGLHYGESLIYPSLDTLWELTLEGAATFVWCLFFFPWLILDYFIFKKDSFATTGSYSQLLVLLLLLTVPMMLYSLVLLIILLICIVCLAFVTPYYILWKLANILSVAPIKNIEKKKKEWDEATKVLELVCDEIDKLPYSGTHHPYYTRPILEAACQNALKVVDEILFRSPDAIKSIDKSAYDIIQLAVIHRSEKVYNLIYDIGERRNLYRTFEDSSKNNILHLAGRLAPSHELNRRTGAALQLQRELQWREEVKNLVFPTYLTRENIFKETPDMVFTREHKNLVKEGEKWMKTTAESCSITAALITTIVFAAAITVPGGSHQDTGIPLFNKNSAFTIFAVFDAISLFASSTALLVFLSILTARFAENDFLVSLPRRLLIGLFSLLLSTTAMMVAFSATLFLVFCDQKLWMLAPICGLAFIPIAFFVTLQFPLIMDLFRSTHLRIFGKQRKSFIRKFNPNDIRVFFGK